MTTKLLEVPQLKNIAECLKLTLLYGSVDVPSKVAIAVYLGGGVPALQRLITFN